MKNRIVSLITILACLAFALSTEAQTPDKQANARRSTRHMQHRQRKPRAKTSRAVTVPQMATTTASGLTYVITQHGTGRIPLAGETVIVNYTGLLGNGTKFDSSLDHGAAFEFPLGAGRVIKGWDEGIAKLHVGDQATLIVPASIGYGARGAGGVIPPNATLIFLVELVGIKEPARPSQD